MLAGGTEILQTPPCSPWACVSFENLEAVVVEDSQTHGSILPRLSVLLRAVNEAAQWVHVCEQ